MNGVNAEVGGPESESLRRSSMKFRRLVPFVALWLVVGGAAFAQTEAHKSFDKIKSFAGSWEGVLSGTGTDLDGKTMHVSLKVTSLGNAVMHEMNGLGRPDDPITMFYLDGDKLMLTHYCDAGNRPRMTGKTSADGKRVDFEFVDVAGSTEYGHMHHAVFTAIDPDHHSEEWTFMVGDKPVHAHFELHRTK
jgi:hypothetical protein